MIIFVVMFDDGINNITFIFIILLSLFLPLCGFICGGLIFGGWMVCNGVTGDDANGFVCDIIGFVIENNMGSFVL